MPDKPQEEPDQPHTEPADGIEPAAGNVVADSTGAAPRLTLRRKAVLAAVVAVVLGGGAGLGVWLGGGGDGDGGGGPREKEYAVTYEVTGDGTATIEYGDAKAAGQPAKRAEDVALPWSRQVSVTRSAGRPAVTVILGDGDGTAQCAVTVAGRMLQTATASGPQARATCIGELPGSGGAGAAGGS